MSRTVKNNNGAAGGTGAKSPRGQALRLIIIIAGAALLLAALAMLNKVDYDALFARIFSPKIVSDGTGRAIEFAVADYAENIFEDEDYLSQNRFIRITDGALSTLVTDGNFTQYGEPVEMLHSYIDSVIAGDAEALPGLFTDGYKKENKLLERFTMQKLYDVEIEFYSMNVINEGKTDQITRYEYLVRYYIQENNGTFRDDVGSDAAVPEIFEVLSYDGEGVVLINSITKILRAVG